MVYAWLLERLDGGEDNDIEGARRGIDNDLGVKMWRRPDEGEKYDAQSLPPNAPSWWFGDEDASQSFLASQGVVL